jgi:GT2 family glycosyltransferase
MPDPQPATETISVVVPTYRRPDALARALAGLTRQADPGAPWDVLVVDNDDSPGAEPVVAAAKDDFSVPIRLVREPRRGASCARNRGIAEAGGTIVAFLDDDVWPRGDWLRQLVVPLLEGRCEGVGGRVVLDTSRVLPGWFDQTWMSRCLSEFADWEEETELGPRDYVLTASAAFRSEPLRATGGLDELLGPRPGLPMVNDDVALCRRFAEVGGTIRYVPDAVVLHELPEARLRRNYFVRRWYAKGRSDWLLERDVLTLSRTGGAGAAWITLLGGLDAHWRAARGQPVDGVRGWTRGFMAVCEMARVTGILREAVAFKLGRGHAAPVVSQQRMGGPV